MFFHSPFELDGHGGDVSVRDGSLRLAAALQGVPPSLQLFPSLPVKLLQPVRLAATRQHHISTTPTLRTYTSDTAANKQTVLHLISALVCAACTCFPRGDSTLSLSI